MKFRFPDKKAFAFTIIDDTDVATLDNVRPMYELLKDLGILSTKTVWPVNCPEGSKNYASSETLQDPRYREFVQQLVAAGFEATWHGATMESSRRQRTLEALEIFRDTFGDSPRIHVNHAFNKENLYWGSGRVDSLIISRAYELLGGLPGDAYEGHCEGSPYWWGDRCESTVEYCRNLTFNKLNLAQINPSMPYSDPKRPLIPRWFSTADAEDVDAFNELLASRNQRRLEKECGFSIVSTHFGKGFVTDGVVNRTTRRLLEELATRSGWFVPAGTMLDWLWDQRSEKLLPTREWRFMQYRWFADLLFRQWKLKFK